MGSQESLLWLRGAGLREERIKQIARGSFIQVGATRMRKTLLLLWWMYICVLELAMGCEELQKPESLSWSLRASIYREKGLPQCTQEVERAQCCEVIPRIT